MVIQSPNLCSNLLTPCQSEGMSRCALAAVFYIWITKYCTSKKDGQCGKYVCRDAKVYKFWGIYGLVYHEMESSIIIIEILGTLSNKDGNVNDNCSEK